MYIIHLLATKNKAIMPMISPTTNFVSDHKEDRPANDDVTELMWLMTMTPMMM